MREHYERLLAAHKKVIKAGLTLAEQRDTHPVTIP
jgi:hypothetical protein